jgi:hypothetical protein
VTEPTVDDAIRLMTDPHNRGAGGAVEGMVRLREAAIMGELDALSNLQRARALVAEAARRLRGTSRVQRVRSSDGGWVERDEIWVPLAVLRDSTK